MHKPEALSAGATTHPWSMLQRIRWQLPLSIAGLLLVVVATSSWLAYREVRDAALDAAGRRLQNVGERLADLLGQSGQPLIDETRALATDPSVLAALDTPVPERVAAAHGALAEVLETSDQISSVALWDSAGRLVTAARRPTDTAAVALEPPGWITTDSTTLGPFRERDGVAWYEVGAPARSSGRTVGFVVQARRLSSSSQARQLIVGLVGMDASFLVGEAGGTWTDFAGVVAGPPREAVEARGATVYRTDTGERRLGTGVRVAGTPWIAWIDFPERLVLEDSFAFLAWLLPIGFGIVLVGTGGGWLLSRRVTAPLSALTSAASAMAEGDFERRVAVDGPAELGELATAFNTMAARVQSAHRGLQEQVVTRTAQLEASEEQFRTLTLSAHEAIIIADGQGRITYVNPAAERTFGYDRDDVVGHPLEVLMPERYREAHRAGLVRFLAGGEPQVIGRTMELEGLRKDGTEFPLELSVATWSTGDGPAFAGVIRDITRRRETEATLRQYAASLEVSNKELDAFAYSVSHDLRAPLRSIDGFSHVLLEDYGAVLDETARGYLDRVRGASQRMGALIDDMLKLSRITRAELRPETVDLSHMAEEIAREIRGTAPDRRAVFEIEPGLEAQGDRRLLQVVLQNLLGNSWKYSVRRDEARIQLTTVQVNGERAFVVRDNGAGFDMKYVDKLFGEFQRLHTDAEFDGTGVGLATVRRIVLRHGGRIWAEGVVDEGASFYFTL